MYVVAFLAAVYTITWRTIGGHAPAPTATAPTATEPEPRFVWIDKLPPAMQPVVVLPAGWQRASQPSVATQPAGLVHVPTPRAPRVRTRSS